MTVEAMVVERFRHAQAMLLAAAPDARQVDESMEPISPGFGSGQGGFESEVVLTDEATGRWRGGMRTAGWRTPTPFAPPPPERD